MAAILNPVTSSLDAASIEHLRTLFQSPGFQVLREVVLAHAGKHMTEVVNRQVNPGGADDIANDALRLAIEFRSCADVLDLLSGSEAKWLRLEINPRR